MAFKMYGKTPMTKALVGMNKYATDAELMAAEKAKLNKDARQQDGKGKTDKEKSSMKKRGCGCKSGACMCK